MEFLYKMVSFKFTASTGGLLGLFMGFSVVSIIEILYFVSLRPYCAHRRFVNKNLKKIKQIEPASKVWYIENDDNNVQKKIAWNKNTEKETTTEQSIFPQIKIFGKKYFEIIKNKFNGNEISPSTTNRNGQTQRYPYTE